MRNRTSGKDFGRNRGLQAQAGGRAFRMPNQAGIQGGFGEARFAGGMPGGGGGPIAATEEYLATYMVLPERSALVIAAWVAAAWRAQTMRGLPPRGT